ncbi:MAG: hypothetical protein O7D27_05005 [Alphaproteobacteria bacterium]|nr:hypothetical protein [Alphaproteobacteria bacterium]MCZ6741507.1 hypothetical protein [Alphaproteobacteria bacterium]MCZ6847489.1 hypothetical protein [Alphaproteobacteria bacterium]
MVPISAAGSAPKASVPAAAGRSRNAMNLSMGWKMGLLGLIAIGALITLFSGSDDGGYRAPQVTDSQEEPIGQFNRAKYVESLHSIAGGRLVSKVEKGLSDHELLLKVGPRWQGQGEQARLRSARALWAAWAKMYPPRRRYQARIVIVDERGAKIGGSRLLDPSKIWVRKK